MGVCYRVDAIGTDEIPSVTRWRATMKWMKPTIEEICIGMEINDYFPAEL
jgi:coenzyme PQQ precursor peptide PqqA